MLKSFTTNNTGNYTLVEAAPGIAVMLKDFIVTIEQGQGEQTGIRLVFTDDENTEIIFKQMVTNKPVEFGMKDLKWIGWDNARLELQVVGNAKCFIVCKGTRVTTNLDYSLWSEY